MSNISQAQNDKHGDPTPARPWGLGPQSPKAGKRAAGAEMGLAASWVESLGVLKDGRVPEVDCASVLQLTEGAAELALKEVRG